MSGRLIYEDRGTRISIMARVNAQGPDTLQQTGSRPTRKNSTCRSGAGHTFGKDRGFMARLATERRSENKKQPDEIYRRTASSPQDN